MAGSKAIPNLEENAVGNASKNDEEVEEPEWVLARRGINFLINNNHAESEALFLQFPNSLVMYSGYSFAVFMVSSNF